MKAMILAAGRGTRLRPLTYTVPKALVPVRGKPMLQWVIERLRAAGADHIAVNAHHLADQIFSFVRNNRFGVHVEVLHEPELLETGGAIAHAYPFLKDTKPVMVHNVDMFSNIDLVQVWNAHAANDAPVTLAVDRPGGEQPFLIDGGGVIVGARNTVSHTQVRCGKEDEQVTEVRFCGVHVISQQFLESLCQRKTAGISIADLYLDYAREGMNIKTFDVGDRFSHDIGTVERYEQINKT